MDRNSQEIIGLKERIDWLKTGAKHNHAKLRLMDDKICAIKGLVVCNVWDVSALGPIERSLLLSAVLRGLKSKIDLLYVC